VGGDAVVAPGGTGTPTSKNIFSSPAGATEISIRAGLPLSFLKECGVPVPPGATTASPPTREEIERLLAAAPRYGVEIRLPGH
jgi:hypothetical protein